jgi:hypothetical protein
VLLVALLAVAAGIGLFVDLELMFSPWIRIPTGLLALALAPVTLVVRAGGELVAPLLALAMGAGGVVLLIGSRAFLENEDIAPVLAFGLILTGAVLGARALSR